MKKITSFRIVIFTLLVCWMVLIFAFSAQKAEQSNKTSGGFVSAIISVFYPEYDNLSAENQEDIFDAVTHFVRKGAHFSEYFVLGVLSYLAAVTFNKYKLVWRSAAAFVLCVLYAASDEWHQYYVPGRACRFTDMLIDASGSLLAVLLLMFIFIKSSKIRNKLGE